MLGGGEGDTIPSAPENQATRHEKGLEGKESFLLRESWIGGDGMEWELGGWRGGLGVDICHFALYGGFQFKK